MKTNKKMYAAFDLHSDSSYLVVQDSEGRIYLSGKLPNDKSAALALLEPFRPALQCVAVESTYNWYWLVDALMDAGHPVRLVHTAAVRQYSGLKHTDDKSDAEWINRMASLDILPTGYIYPKAMRPVRDLLRRRAALVRSRTGQLLSLHNVIARSAGESVTGERLKKMSVPKPANLLKEEMVLLNGTSILEVVRTLDTQIGRLEKTLLDNFKLDPAFENLKSVPGVGEVLGLSISLETGEISRFKTVGNFASYCRMVKSEKTSNKKKKGKGNTKNGNSYLCWAFMEAAQQAIRHHPPAQRHYQRNAARKKRVVARKILAHKLARASYYVMRDQVPFDSSRLFG